MATQLAGALTVTGQDIMLSSSTQQLPLGTYAETTDGRGFRYVKVGAVSTVPGKVYQGPAEDTTNQNPSGGLAVAAQAIGDTSVTLTGSLTLAANLLAGGYLSVCASTGLGQLYRIKGNTAVTAAANCVVTLEDPIRVALTTSSKVTLKVNPYNGIVIAPATMTNCIVGVAHTVLTNAQYGWIQVRGIASCLQTGTGTCGTALGYLQAGTSGSLAPAIAGTPILATALGTNVTTEYDTVFLNIS